MPYFQEANQNALFLHLLPSHVQIKHLFLVNQFMPLLYHYRKSNERFLIYLREGQMDRLTKKQTDTVTMALLGEHGVQNLIQ